MPMIDLTDQSAEADGQLNKFSIKADGKAEDAYLYEADLIFVIASVEDAKILDKIFPGAVRVQEESQREDTNWKFNATVNPDITGVKATLSHASRGKVAIDGGCEVKSVRLRASKKAIAATVKLVFGGQTAGTAAKLTALLRTACCLSIEKNQQVIPFPTKGVAPAVPGDLVAVWDSEVGQHYVGLVAESEDGRLTLDDHGNEYTVSADEVVAVVKLDGDIKALIRSFKTRCKRRDIQPTWEAILLAGAEGNSLLDGGGTLTLDSEVLERAVARLQSGDAEMLPPEPGEDAAEG